VKQQNIPSAPDPAAASDNQRRADADRVVAGAQMATDTIAGDRIRALAGHDPVRAENLVHIMRPGDIR
jgi:hypothetical protein